MRRALLLVSNMVMPQSLHLRQRCRWLAVALIVLGQTVIFAQNQTYFTPPPAASAAVLPSYGPPVQPELNAEAPYANTAVPSSPSTAPLFAAPELGGPPPSGNQSSQAPARSTTMSVDPNYQRKPLGDTQLQVAPSITTWGEFTSAQIVARVGGETILAGDLLGPVTRILEPHRAQMSPEQYEAEKLKLMKAFLDQTIETKIVFADAMSKFPKENLEKMHAAVNEQFEKNIIPSMMSKSKAANRADLEKKLADTGSSLEKQNRMFFERSVAAQWMKQSLKAPSEIPLADVLAYYKNHQADYEFKAQVRWEELMISYEKVPDRNQAFQQLATLGNQVLAGQSFAELAKTSSHGVTAYKGGQYDWTTEGSLRSVITDQAIHALPVGQMSQILQDNDGVRIVRVLERKPAGRTPFEEAQPEIKKKLLEEAEKKSEDEYLALVKQRVPVWTIFDGQIDPAELTIKSNGQKKR
jgi:parvulin-like peptidyl-prolyl isomerase